MFTRSSMIRGHLIPALFGVSMLAFGCANFGEGAAKLSNAWDTKVSPATTQAAQSTAEVAGTIAAVAPGTPVGNVASIILAICGAIIAGDRIISVTLKGIANASKPPPPPSVAATNSNDQNQPPLAVVPFDSLNKGGKT